MSANTITQAQGKGLRHHFTSACGVVRTFSNALYAAHGGWLPAPNQRRTPATGA
jgi:hypothetical protein